MRTFEFSIVVSGVDPHADDFEARFYDAGCDDATVSFQKGRIILDFAREAASIEDAITSAISATRSAGATVNLVARYPLLTVPKISEPL